MVNVLKILAKSSPGAGVQGTAPALHSSLGTALWGCPGHRWGLEDATHTSAHVQLQQVLHCVGAAERNSR